MATFKLRGNTVNTNGPLPEVGHNAPDFILTKTDMKDVTLADFKGHTVILNVFPSVDTPVCSASVRRFNQEVTKLDGVKVLSVSLDLPFAHNRFCEAEGIKNVISTSELRNRDFGNSYGLRIAEGALKGLLARAVIVLGESSKVVYAKLVEDLSNEPDYESIIGVVQDHLTKQASGLNVCTSASTPEHARIGNPDDPCDDGRAGA
ncbi:MAG: thiol peroxidase [Proteobacteria bacterium]|nr:thiol peroxidase [Pseudomonadota bacterium]